MKPIIRFLFILIIISSNCCAQKDSIIPEVVNTQKKFGVGLTFSTIFFYNKTPQGFMPEEKSAFYDLYKYNWPFPVPPGIEVVYQPSQTFTYLLGLKYKSIHNYTPEQSSSIYNFRSFTSSFQANYAPFKIKQYPFVGLKLAYQYKFFKYDWMYSDDYQKTSTSNLVSLQIPIGYSFNIKNRITINIETTLNLCNYSTVNYTSNDVIGPFPNTSTIKTEERQNKFHTTIDLVKENHFLDAIWLKFYYRFNFKKD